MGHDLTGRIEKERSLTAVINKGIGMGALPEASGLSEFPSPAYSVNGRDLMAVSEAVQAGAGVAAPVWPGGFVAAVGGLGDALAEKTAEAERLAAEHISTVPEAAGRSEFPAEQYRVAGDDLREVAAAIAQKSGIPAPVWPEGFMEAVAGIKEPEEVFYSLNGVAYTKNMVIPVNKPELSMNGLYSRAGELESVALPNANSTATINPSVFGASTFEHCAKLRTAQLPKAQYLGHYVFRNCPALERVQIGSVGFGATHIGSLCFAGTTQNTLHITVYVADGVPLPLENSPWGATNATVIYRSATTGEVMEV